MTKSRSAIGWGSCAAAALLVVLGACASTTGLAVRASGSSIATSATTTATTATTATSATSSGSTPPGQTSATPGPPPTCGGTINRLNTPTGAPIITVTTGAGFFLADPEVEPLSLAVYADGTALSSSGGAGSSSGPLPRMTIGYLPPCTLEWAKIEISQLATAKMGHPDVTDQGNTEVVYRGSGVPEVHLSAYALDIDEKYVLTGREGRTRLITLLAALRAPLAGASTWTPDRLLVVQRSTPSESAGPALLWPGGAHLEQVLTDRRFNDRCGIVGGADAAAVLRTLGDRAVHSRWTDAGRVTGLSIGALVPGQSGCTPA